SAQRTASRLAVRARLHRARRRGQTWAAILDGRVDGRRLAVEILEERTLLSADLMQSLADSMDGVALRQEVVPGGFIVRTRSVVVDGAPQVEASQAAAPSVIFNPAGTFDIVLQMGPGLVGNAAASAAFERAAEFWESQFTDPVTVHIDADLDS